MSANQFDPWCMPSLKISSSVRKDPPGQRSKLPGCLAAVLAVSEDSGRKLTRLSLSDLTAERVRGFLRFLGCKSDIIRSAPATTGWQPTDPSLTIWLHESPGCWPRHRTWLPFRSSVRRPLRPCTWNTMR